MSERPCSPVTLICPSELCGDDVEAQVYNHRVRISSGFRNHVELDRESVERLRDFLIYALGSYDLAEKMTNEQRLSDE